MTETLPKEQPAIAGLKPLVTTVFVPAAIFGIAVFSCSTTRSTLASPAPARKALQSKPGAKVASSAVAIGL